MHSQMTITLDEGYKAMAADKDRESEAQEWCDALADDMAVETAIKVHPGMPQ